MKKGSWTKRKYVLNIKTNFKCPLLNVMTIFYFVHLYLGEFEGTSGITQLIVLCMRKRRQKLFYLPRMLELFILGKTAL